jgi:hypothetical protein
MNEEKEVWETIEEFPNYAVSNLGRVVNTERGRQELKGRPNQFGHIRVGLVRDGVQYTRGLAPLVATMFVPKPEEFEHFTTPIHKDGDLYNCRADNLLWRSRPFAIKFHQQFWIDQFHVNYRDELVELDSGVKYPGVKEACIDNGLYWFDVVKSYVEETFVPITYQEFRLVNTY